MHAIRSIFPSLAAKGGLSLDPGDGYCLTVWGVAFGAISAAIVALPSNKEVAYGLIGDKNYAMARARLVDLHTKGEGDLHSAIALHEVHLRFGELDQAGRVIRDVLKGSTTNIELLTRDKLLKLNTHFTAEIRSVSPVYKS